MMGVEYMAYEQEDSITSGQFMMDETTKDQVMRWRWETESRRMEEESRIMEEESRMMEKEWMIAEGLMDDEQEELMDEPHDEAFIFGEEWTKRREEERMMEE
jgi:hypothetical protein